MHDFRHFWLPVVALLVGATLWGVMWWPLRYFESLGLWGPWLSLWMYAIVAIATLPWIWRGWRQWSGNWHASLLLIAFGGWANVAFVLALLEGEVVRVLLLFYLAPVWSILAGRVFLGEALSWRRLAIVALALSGAVVMLVPHDSVMDDPLSRADLLALSSGLCFALSNVVIRQQQGIDNLHKAWMVWFGCALVAATMVSGQEIAAPSLTLAGTLQLAVFSLTWVAAATLVVQYGVARMEVGRSSVILLFELIAGAVSAAWLAGETTTWAEWTGGALIVTAAILEARAHWRTRNQT